ncbi:MAG TPA: hypothetical protein VFB66_05475 [Tepidisphaeraceae bacterium]|nr:hypothetical protein [Tepidisphaeraceae bacterium]
MGSVSVVSAINRTLADEWALFASSKLNVAPSQLVVIPRYYMDEGEIGDLNVLIANNATRSPQAKALRLSTGVTAAASIHVADAPRQVADRTPRTVPTGAAEKVLFVARQRINGPAASTARLGCGLFDSATSRNLLMGVNGDVSAANFTCFGASGVSINSGLAIDAAWRTHVYWRDGANGFYQIDSLAPVAGTARVLNDSYRCAHALDSAGGTDRTVDFAWSFIAVVSP